VVQREQGKFHFVLRLSHWASDRRPRVLGTRSLFRSPRMTVWGPGDRIAGTGRSGRYLAITCRHHPAPAAPGLSRWPGAPMCYSTISHWGRWSGSASAGQSCTRSTPALIYASGSGIRRADSTIARASRHRYRCCAGRAWDRTKSPISRQNGII
jgi:hypothetical protein